MTQLRTFLAVLLVAFLATRHPSVFAEAYFTDGDELALDSPLADSAFSDAEELPEKVAEMSHVQTAHGHHCSQDGGCSHLHSGHFTITKHAVVADGGPGVDQVGDIIRYTAVISNPGPGPLTVLNAYDSFVQLSGGPPLPTILPPGGKITFSGQYVVESADLRKPTIENTITATTKEWGCKSASAVVPIRSPGCKYDFTIKKTAAVAGGGTEVTEAGDIIHYTVVIRNTGNRPLTLDSVQDSLVTLDGTNTGSVVVPVHGSVTYTGNYEVKTKDLHKGQIENTVTAMSREAGSRHDSASVDVGKCDCPKCKSKDCCKWVIEEFVVPKDVKVRKCYTIHVPQEKTVPYCCNECQDGKCIEVLGTKTVRQFVQTKKVETVTEQVPKICKRRVWKCVTCGADIDECPEERYSSADIELSSEDELAASTEQPEFISAAIGEKGGDAKATDFVATTPKHPRGDEHSRQRFQLVTLRSTLFDKLLQPDGSGLAPQITIGAETMTQNQDTGSSHCCHQLAPDADGSSTPIAPNWSALDPDAPLANCTKCKCEKCCSTVVDEKLEVREVDVKVCVKVYKAEDKTKAHCDAHCVDGDCIEVLGTKTIRRLVPRIEEQTIRLRKYVVVQKEPEEKCLKCGYHLHD